MSTDGQAIGVGAGQQSRIHCTRLAGNKADIWCLRQHPKVLDLPVQRADIRRADRDNAIDVYIGDDSEDVLADGVWQNTFTERPEAADRAGKEANGSRTLPALRWARTRSSPSETTSSGRTAAA